MNFNSKSVEVTTSTDNPLISVEDMATFLRIDVADQNALIASYIEAATEACKQYTRRALKTETLTYRADGFVRPDGDERMARLGPGVHVGSKSHIYGSAGYLHLPFPPLQSVTSITTYATDDTSSVFSSSNYLVDLQGGRICLNESRTWPTSLRAHNAVEIVYVAGYGSGSVPAPVLEAIRRYVAHLFDGCEGMTAEIKRLLAPYRLMDELAW